MVSVMQRIFVTMRLRRAGRPVSCAPMSIALGAMLMLSNAGAIHAAEEPTAEVQIVSAYVQALNRGDLKAVRKLLSSEFELLQPWPACAPSVGPSECHLLKLNETVVRDREKRTITVTRQELDVIRANMTIQSDALKKHGLERVLITEEFVVQDGKIRSSLVTLRTEDAQTRRYSDGRQK